MKQIITAKLKLNITKEQKELLRDISLAYRDGLNYASNEAFKLNKTTNANLLHKNCYSFLRSDFNLPSQTACGVSRYVAGAYKSLWTKAKKNYKHLKSGATKKRYKGLDKAPHFSSRTVIYQYGKDYTFKSNQQVSILTLQGRIIISYSGWNHHIDLIQNEAHIGAAQLYYDKTKKTYYLMVSLELDIPNSKPSDHKSVIGVDLGQRYLSVTTDTKNNTQFISGKQVVHKANQYSKKKKELQTKKKRNGTRSIIRRLIALSKRERRYKNSLNHQTACKILKQFPNSLIGMENLTDIREKTNRHTSNKDSKKRKKANKNQSNWAFTALQTFLAYKANLQGSMTVKVDAHYTSQMCPICGHTSKENRPNKGLMFICKNCGFTLHADLIGARNITMRTLLIRQDWLSKGCLSNSLDASDNEIKADNLLRYSELRWSPEVKVENLISI